MDITTIIESDKFTKALIGVGLVVAALVIFEAGMYVGVHKTEFSLQEGDEFYRVFDPGAGPGALFGSDFTTAHGAAGKVISVSLPTFVVEQTNNTEKVIAVTDDTQIRSFRDATSSGAIRAGNFVIVIGEPDQNGRIDATLVRLVPPPPPHATTTAL